MAGFVLPTEDAGPADHADRGGDKRIPENMALSGEGINVRGLANLVASKPERVEAQVVDQKKEDVGLLRGGFGGGRAVCRRGGNPQACWCEEGKEKESQSHVDSL